MGDHFPQKPFKVVVAPNALKESLSARDTAAAIARGVHTAVPSAEIHELPLSDGGDGMLEAMLKIKKGQKVEISVSNPLGRQVDACYGILEDGTAVIEMSLASGLDLVPPTERNALMSSTFGTGELIRHAIGRGCRRFIVGIGGSATTDGGAGMASALGFQFFNQAGDPVSPNGAGLAGLSRVDDSGILPEVKACSFRIACDVSNPLLGPQGAARTYAPQKGASIRETAILENNLTRLADVLEIKTGVTYRHTPGTGAAGGLGFFFLSSLNASLLPGAGLILEECGFESLIQHSCFIVTAEGSLDSQSAHGKLPAAIAAAGKKAGIPVVALCGSLKPGWESLRNSGLTAAFAIAPGPVSLKKAMANAREYMAEAAREITALFQAAYGETQAVL